jgi:Predicted membrane protein (DUF2232)
MRHWLPLALAAGTASGLLNVSGAVGAPLGLLLGHATLLPLFLSGLGLGLPGALTSGLVGTLVVALVAGPAPALVFGALDACPVLLLCRQALLSRAAPDGSREWYPGGLLLCWLMGVVVAGYLLVLMAFELFGPGLTAAVSAMIDELVKAMGSSLPADGAAALRRSAPLIPGIAAAYYMVNAVINASLAQHLLRRSGRNLRPSVRLSELTLPPQVLWALLASLAVALLLPALAPFAYALAFIGVVAYFLLGLAVVHAILRTRTNRGTALFSFYAMLALLMVLLPAVGIVMAGLGALEQLVGLRRRIGGGGGGGKEDA